MMSYRLRKILLCSLVFLIVGLITSAIIYQFAIIDRRPKNVTALGENEQTNWTVEDFDGSELRFFANHTFHLKIVNATLDETIFIGIGTYKKTNKQYKLTFIDVVGGDIDEMNAIMDEQGKRQGLNKVRIIDANGQIYYFS